MQSDFADSEDQQFESEKDYFPHFPFALRMSEVVPDEPPSSVRLAAEWILSPDAMLHGFVDSFNKVMSHTEFFTLGPNNAITVRLKEGIDATDRMLIRWEMLELLLSIRLIQREGVNPPLAIDAIRDAMASTSEGDWEKFTIAVCRWSDSIIEVSKWLCLRKLISAAEPVQKGTSKKRSSKTASFDEYRTAWLSLETANIEPSRENLSKVIRVQYGKTLGGDNFTRYRTRFLKELQSRPSAVRPPESAD
jgi:hypothetical protein